MTKAELQKRYDELVMDYATLSATCAIQEQKIQTVETVEKAVRAAHEELKQSSYEERQALEAKVRRVEEKLSNSTRVLENCQSEIRDLNSERSQFQKTATVFAMLYFMATKSDVVSALEDFWSMADYCLYSNENLGSTPQDIFFGAFKLVGKVVKQNFDYEKVSNQQTTINVRLTQGQIDELVRAGFLNEMPST